MTSDPIGLAGGLNKYGYVSGNPVNLFDQMGLKTQDDGLKPKKAKKPKGLSCLKIREKCKKNIAQRCRQQHGRIDQCNAEGAPNSSFADGHQTTCVIQNSVNCTNTYVQCLADITRIPTITKPIIHLFFDNDIKLHPHFELK